MLLDRTLFLSLLLHSYLGTYIREWSTYLPTRAARTYARTVQYAKHARQERPLLHTYILTQYGTGTLQNRCQYRYHAMPCHAMPVDPLHPIHPILRFRNFPSLSLLQPILPALRACVSTCASAMYLDSRYVFQNTD